MLPMFPLQVVHEDPLLKVTTWDIVLGVRWYDIPTLKGLARFRTVQSRHIRTIGEKKP